jgi:hypothetical protein
MGENLSQALNELETDEDVVEEAPEEFVDPEAPVITKIKR